MTNTIHLLIDGAAIGAGLTAAFVLWAIRGAKTSAGKTARSAQQANEDNLRELRRRNDIGERQVAALETIAKLAAISLEKHTAPDEPRNEAA